MAQFSSKQHGKKHWLNKPEQEDRGCKYLPSPAEIRQECLKIQAHWTEDTRLDKCCYPVEPVKVTRCHDVDLGLPGTGRQGYSVEGRS